MLFLGHRFSICHGRSYLRLVAPEARRISCCCCSHIDKPSSLSFVFSKGVGRRVNGSGISDEHCLSWQKPTECFGISQTTLLNLGIYITKHSSGIFSLAFLIMVA